MSLACPQYCPAHCSKVVMDPVNYRKPALNSTSARITTNQKLMNIRQAQVGELLREVRAGNGRAGFSEQDGNLMYTDASGPVPGKVVGHVPGKAEDGGGEKWTRS